MFVCVLNVEGAQEVIAQKEVGWKHAHVCSDVCVLNFGGAQEVNAQKGIDISLLPFSALCKFLLS